MVVRIVPLTDGKMNSAEDIRPVLDDAFEG